MKDTCHALLGQQSLTPSMVLLRIQSSLNNRIISCQASLVMFSFGVRICRPLCVGFSLFTYFRYSI